MNNGLAVRVGIVVSLLVPALGCDRLSFSKDKDDEDALAARRREFPLHVVNTVSQYAGLIGHGRVIVHGYGVVVGLGRNGSSEVPPHLERYLVQHILKSGTTGSFGERPNVTPSRILRDLDTAAVYVRGAIPAAAPKGTPFDVVVTALPATGTQSLEGGILMPTELRLDVGSFQPGEGSRIWGSARGPVMTNPFIDPSDRQERAKLREAVVVGGGVSHRDRNVNLQLYRADYARADQIQRRINAQFPGADRVANAKNSSLIELFIPPVARADREHFLELITHLPLQTGAVEWEVHTREIITEMNKDDAEHEALSLVLEAYGRKVLPMLSTLYDSPIDAAAFYAARAGARLGDNAASSVIIRFAEAQDHSHQLPGIETLGEARSLPQSERALRGLLDDPNDMVRIAAYEALRKRKSAYVISVPVGGQCVLDIVPTEGPPLVYATRTEHPRIVLFGHDQKLARPVFFTMPEELVTLNAEADDDHVAVWRKLPGRDRYSETFYVPFDVSALVRMLGERPERNLEGKVKGLGLTYGQLVSIMHRLCQERHIPASFVLQPDPVERELLKRVMEADAYDTEGA